MPFELKETFNKDSIELLAAEIKKNYPKFKKDKFCTKILDKNWKARELKERMRHISLTLGEFLPSNYNQALKVLFPVAPKVKDALFAMVFPDFVEVYGLEKEKDSIAAMKHFTKVSSSEFAIRPFIIKNEDKFMKLLLQWSKDSNYHVRRLASEGCRPRLPWACALPRFKKEQKLVEKYILPILENLKNDQELYVRRSVANNLNDISKDFPQLALAVAKKWHGRNKELDWVVKHGLRTLLKKGNTKALTLFGQGSSKNFDVKKLKLQIPSVKIGNKLSFSFELNSRYKKKASVRIEYAIYYLKSNGSHSKKVFKLSENSYPPGVSPFKRSQSFKQMTTRKHYPGEHFLAIIVNGEEKTKVKFKVTK